jgi:hypothetical protein
VSISNATCPRLYIVDMRHFLNDKKTCKELNEGYNGDQTSDWLELMLKNIEINY